MAKAPTRPKAEADPPPRDDRTPLERMTDLTRRVVNVPKDEALAETKPQRAPRLRKLTE